MTDPTDPTEPNEPVPAQPECLLSIAALVSRERNPDLHTVLMHYRAAEMALQWAIDHLREISRPRWALACSSRAHELCVQANRYIAAERKAESKP
jgi:hypothetical protein